MVYRVSFWFLVFYAFAATLLPNLVLWGLLPPFAIPGAAALGIPLMHQQTLSFFGISIAAVLILSLTRHWKIQIPRGLFIVVGLYVGLLTWGQLIVGGDPALL